MYEIIKNFPKQFDWKPEVQNAAKLKKYQKFIVCGMGGSNLVADIIKMRIPKIDIISWKNYKLPELDKKILKKTLIIANSYSGNTEETLDAFKLAMKMHLPIAVISSGGRLLGLARKYKKPYIRIPNDVSQPRLAIGYNIMAIVKILNNKLLLRELKGLSSSLKSYNFERNGRELARKLKGQIPVIYSSFKNKPIAYVWKVKLNETGKIPAFTNEFPELNHNEMTGFDVKNFTREISKNILFLFLKDVSDHPRIAKRMNITERLYRERGFLIEVIIMNGTPLFYKIFSSLILADWTSYYTAKEYGVDPEQVPMVEELKKLIK